MEENIVNLLKDAFSEVDIDFEHLQLDEAAYTSQPQPLLDENMDDVNKNSVYKAEGDDEISDNSEDSDLSDLANIKTEPTHCLSHAIKSDQTEENSVPDVQVFKRAADECKTNEGSLQKNSEAGVSLHGLVADDSAIEGEKYIQRQKASNCLNSNLESSECQLLVEDTSYPVPAEGQSHEELSSESDEEELDNYGALEECGLSEFYGNKDNTFVPITPNDLREFTEEDQEQIAESLADYPSDLSPSESEECAEGLEGQLPIIKDKTKNSSSDEEENVPGYSTNLNALIGNQEEEKLLNRATKEEEHFNMEQQGCPKNDKNLKEVSMDEDDAKELSDKNGEAFCGRDDDNASHETTGVCLSVKRKVEWKRARQNNIAIEDLLGAEDCKDTEKSNDSGSEKVKGTQSDGSLTGFNTVHEESTKEVKVMHYNLVSDQSEANDSDNNQSLCTPPPIKQDAQTLIHDVLLSSEALMTDDKLLLDEYDWDLTGEQIFKNLSDDENQEHIGDTNEDFDDFEENERDWEQEMIRIEAFNKFYGDQDATEDYIRRNHKVTFSLNHDSSVDDEDYSDSTEEEELDNILTPVQMIQPEYHSDSDEPQQKHSYSEKSKSKIRVQQNVSPTLKQSTPTNRCLSLLKSTLALVLVVGTGLAYYWWATETMEPIQ